MNGKTNQLVQEIQKKIKNPITKKHQFSTANMVLEFAVQDLYTKLKMEKLM